MRNLEFGKFKLYSEDHLSIEDIESLKGWPNIREQKEKQLIEFLKRAPVGTQIKISPTKTLKFEERNGKRTVLEFNK